MDADFNIEQAKEATKTEITKIEVELETAKENLKVITEKLNAKKSALKALEKLEGKSTKKKNRYTYKVNTDTLKNLYKDQEVIYGVKDLFRKVLEIKDEIGNIFDYEKSQISTRIKTQGMKKVEEYCVIKQESPRIFYIKAIKDRDTNMKLKSSDINLKEFNRHIKIEEQRAKLESIHTRNKI